MTIDNHTRVDYHPQEEEPNDGKNGFGACDLP
jgi:hypothetical protein